MEALEQTKEPTIPELLSQYLELRSGQRADWTSRGKLKGTVADFNKVQAAMDFLRKKESPPWRALTPGWTKSARPPFLSWRA